MASDDDFLRAILEDPGDDSLRLVYADWLEERGDPRGEFIRVQVELARMADDDPGRPDLEWRERELLQDHGDQWRAPLPAWAHRGCQFRRGFVGFVACDAAQFLAGAADLVAAAPLERLRLTGLHEHLKG